MTMPSEVARWGVEDKPAMSPLVVEILDSTMQQPDADSCLCCASPADDALNVVSELIVEQPEQPVSGILQELLAVPQVSASARLCQACLEKVLHYHQLAEVLAKLQREMRRSFAETSASRSSRSIHVEEASSEEASHMTVPAPPSPPPPASPPPEQQQQQQQAQESQSNSESQPELNISIQVLEPPSEETPEPAREAAVRLRLVCAEPGCGRTFHSRGVLQHHRERRHGPAGGRPCPECPLVAGSEHQLADHIRAVHKAGEAVYGCDECEQRFHLEAELKLHRRSQHDAKRYIKCRHCRKVFRSRQSYLEHQAKHSGQKLIECPVCSEKFTRRVCLTVHMKVHRKHGSVHACEQCGEKFSTIGRARTHQKQQHGIQQPWRCEATGCDKSFRSRAALEVHSVNHTGDRQYSCDVCNKRFSTKHRMQAHYRIHTGERPFQCALCGRQFTHKSNLHQHNALAHKTERNHKCCECGRAFRRARELETHRSVSHPASDAAPAPAPAPADADRPPLKPYSHGHKQYSHGHKQYKCAVCYRAFLRLDNLRTHMFVHSEKKPFECRECGLGFLRRPQLLLHMQAAGHGDGMSDYVINEAVFVMDAAPAAGSQGSVRLISAGQHQVFSVVDDGGTQLDGGEPAVAQIIFKTDGPRAHLDSPGVARQDDQQIVFKTNSPRTDLDSSRAVRQVDRQIVFNTDSSRAALDSPGAARQTEQQIIFKPDSPRADLDSPRIVQLDEQQIIFKADSPRTNLGSSGAGRQDDQTSERWQQQSEAMEQGTGSDDRWQ